MILYFRDPFEYGASISAPFDEYSDSARSVIALLQGLDLDPETQRHRFDECLGVTRTVIPEATHALVWDLLAALKSFNTEKD